MYSSSSIACQAAAVLSPHTTRPVDTQPQDFCGRVARAQVAHHARLTVNSEEILASLLEALGNGRSEATRGQLFDATAALAQSFEAHGGQDLDELDGARKTSAADAATGRGLRGIPATLKKGLPAVVRAVLVVLECPVRRAYTWKERKAALEVISSLAVLTELRGAQGPLGEHRTKLIRGASRGKHDSVAAVREAAIESLVALEATEADESKPELRRPVSAPAGVGRFAGSATEMMRKFRREDRGLLGKGAGPPKIKILDGIVRKAERAMVASAEVLKHKTKRDGDSLEGGSKSPTPREEQDDAEVTDPHGPAESKPASSVGQDSLVASTVKQTAATQTSRMHLESPFPAIDGRESEHINEHHNAASRRKLRPLVADNGDSREFDVATREPPELVSRQSSGDKKTSAPGAHADVADAVEKDRGIPVPPRRPASPEAKHHAPAEVEVSVPDARLPQTALSQAVKLVPQRQDAEYLTAPSGHSAGNVAKVDSSPLPAPMHGGMQVDTLRLLKHLDSKTDKITSVLDGLDRRILGVERTLVVSF